MEMELEVGTETETDMGMGMDMDVGTEIHTGMEADIFSMKDPDMAIYQIVDINNLFIGLT
jgi:hypothetical protein